jgi:mono/diheme cytochrome c family protein
MKRIVWGVGLGALLLAGRVDAVARATAQSGVGLYLTYCAPCHGPTGRGDGPEAAIFTPRPRNLRDGLLDRYDTPTLARTVRDGAALPLALDPPALERRGDEVEAIVGWITKLPDVNWDRVWHGQDVFIDRCTGCHGAFGRPDPTLPAKPVAPPRDLSDPKFQASITDADLLSAVRHGRKGMAPVKGLEREDDARALLAYVRTLSPGYILYTRYCASCHGEDGKGGDLVDPGLVPSIAFDRDYVRTHDPERLRAKVWHMLAGQRPAMPHFRVRLNEGQARAIVEYLKKTK